MRRTFRGAAPAALLLLAACGGDAGAGDAPAADSAAVAVAPATTDTVLAAPAADTAMSAFPATPGAAAPPAPAGAAPPERPAPPNPITAEEARGYVLTMERVRQLARAGGELAELQRANPALRDSMAVGAADPNAVLERLMNVPEARAAVERAGITPRDYTLSTVALLQAAMAHQIRTRGGSIPEGVNEANVRLVTENWEEIQGLMRRTMERARGPSGGGG